MIEYVCDSCGKRKRDDQNWILGLAAENIGIVSARREVNILSRWAEAQAVHPLAVHFCSEKCKEKYMEKLFASDIAA